MSDKSNLVVGVGSSEKRLIMLALEAFGISNKIAAARDGAEARDDVFATGHYQRRDTVALPALILLELPRPPGDGLELGRRLRADDRTTRVPVVVLTTSSQDEGMLAGYAFTSTAYLRKPADFAAYAGVAKTSGLFRHLLNASFPTGLASE